MIGLDLDARKVADYQSGYDATGEVSEAELHAADHLEFTTQPLDLKGCEVFIVAVPTPVDSMRNPDFGPLLSASRTVGSVMGPGSTVVYESTVYPGATEEICVPELEIVSGLTWKEDFSVGYSPERINPGDPEHTLATITKVVSADNDETLDMLAELYGEVVFAGIHRAPSIRVAEAAKVIENTQRDLNIALINELAVLFDELSINTRDVLDAAGSKWNFLPFTPGLVGGHCVGVDPYYLTHKAMKAGYYPEIILTGRKLNDSMGKYVANEIINLMTKKRIQVVDSNILVMGLTFKEDCPDIRNTRVVDVVQELNGFHCNIDVYDPWIDKEESTREYGITPVEQPEPGKYDAVIIAVAHHQFKAMGITDIRALGKKNHVLYDIKYILPAEKVDGRL